MVQSPGGEGGGGVCDAAARRYWDGMNRRDIDYALEQFSDEIFFQDMMFPDAFVGKEKLRSHFKACLDGFPEGLVFVIDEISVDAGDGKCGAYWHCETPEGKAFPFSRGLSFYKCDGERFFSSLSFAAHRVWRRWCRRVEPTRARTRTCARGLACC